MIGARAVFPRTRHQLGRSRGLWCAALTFIAVPALALSAQVPGGRIPGGCEAPAASRPNPVGCYLLATEPVAPGPRTALFWHIYEYPTPAAANAAASRSGVGGARAPRPAAWSVVAAFGRTWGLALADSQWRPTRGRRVDVVGPLAVGAGKSYVARYMEAVFEPGMYTAVHRHAGPEAWHLVTGAQCLQTPDTTFVVPAGRSAVVPAGPPMRLSGVSAETRRALVLVLHEPAEPWMTLDTGWVPRTTC